MRKHEKSALRLSIYAVINGSPFPRKHLGLSQLKHPSLMILDKSPGWRSFPTILDVRNVAARHTRLLGPFLPSWVGLFITPMSFTDVLLVIFGEAFHDLTSR